MRLVLLCILLFALQNGAYCASTNLTKTELESLPIPYWPNKTKLTICTAEYTPMIYCNPDADQSTYTGFEIEFFRNVAEELKWDPSVYEFKCMEFSKLEEDIFSGGSLGNGTCDMAVAGYSALSFLEDTKGFVYTWPCIRVGKIIMVKAVREEPGMWFFLSAISAEVWIILLITAVVSGVIIWFMEVASEALNPDTRWMSNVMWDTVGRPVQMRDYRLSSLAGNLLALMWSFSAFIIMAMYIGNLSANLTTSQITSSIHGVADLPGKRVSTWEDFVDPLKKYNVIATGFPWENAHDERVMIDSVKSGKFQALVMESPTLYVHDATDCETKLIEPQFDTTDIAQVFPPGFQNYALLEYYNAAVIRILEAGVGEALNKRFIQVPQAACKSGDITNSKMQVEFSQVSGLWVMMGATLGIGLLVLGWIWIPRWIASSKRLSKWLPCCVALSKPNRKFQKAYTALVKVGHGSKRTPKSAQPRVPYTDEFYCNGVPNRYAGSSAGYLDGSNDIVPRVLGDSAEYMDDDTMYYSTMNQPSMPGRNFEGALLAQLAKLQSSVARLEGRYGNDGGVNGGRGGSGRRPASPIRLSSANAHMSPDEQEMNV